MARTIEGMSEFKSPPNLLAEGEAEAPLSDLPAPNPVNGISQPTVAPTTPTENSSAPPSSSGPPPPAPPSAAPASGPTTDAFASLQADSIKQTHDLAATQLELLRNRQALQALSMGVIAIAVIVGILIYQRRKQALSVA